MELEIVKHYVYWTGGVAYILFDKSPKQRGAGKTQAVKGNNNGSDILIVPAELQNLGKQQNKAKDTKAYKYG
jgi:hypothetical protein